MGCRFAKFDDNTKRYVCSETNCGCEFLIQTKTHVITCLEKDL